MFGQARVRTRVGRIELPCFGRPWACANWCGNLYVPFSCFAFFVRVNHRRSRLFAAAVAQQQRTGTQRQYMAPEWRHKRGLAQRNPVGFLFMSRSQKVPKRHAGHITAMPGTSRPCRACREGRGVLTTARKNGSLGKVDTSPDGARPEARATPNGKGAPRGPLPTRLPPFAQRDRTAAGDPPSPGPWLGAGPRPARESTP